MDLLVLKLCLKNKTRESGFYFVKRVVKFCMLTHIEGNLYNSKSGKILKNEHIE